MSKNLLLGLAAMTLVATFAFLSNDSGRVHNASDSSFERLLHNYVSFESFWPRISK
jgi:hypothetical protein